MSSSPDHEDVTVGYNEEEDKDYDGNSSAEDEDEVEEQKPPKKKKSKTSTKSRKRMRRVVDSDDDASAADEEESEGEDVEDDDGRSADPDEESALAKLEKQEMEDSKGLIVSDSEDSDSQRDTGKMLRKQEKDKREEEDEFEKQAKKKLKVLKETSKQEVIAEAKLSQQKKEKEKRDAEAVKKQQELLKNQMDVEDSAKTKKLEAAKKFGKRQRADSEDEDDDDAERSIGDTLSKAASEKEKKSAPRLVQTPLVMNKVKPEDMFKDDTGKKKSSANSSAKPKDSSSSSGGGVWKIGDVFKCEGLTYVLTHIAREKPKPSSQKSISTKETEWANSQKLAAFSTCVSSRHVKDCVKDCPRDPKNFDSEKMGTLPIGMRSTDAIGQKEVCDWFQYCVVPDSKDFPPVVVDLNAAEFASATKGQESKEDKMALNLNLYNAKSKDEGTKGRGERVTRPWSQYNLDTNAFIDKKSGSVEYYRLLTHPGLARKKYFDNEKRKEEEKRKKDVDKSLEADDTPAGSSDEDEDAPDAPPLKSKQDKKSTVEAEKKAALEKAGVEREKKEKEKASSSERKEKEKTEAKTDKEKEKAEAKAEKPKKRKAGNEASSNTEQDDKRVKFDDEHIRRVVKEVMQDCFNEGMRRFKEAFVTDASQAYLPYINEGNTFRLSCQQALNDINVRVQSIESDVVNAEQMKSILSSCLQKPPKKSSVAPVASAPIPVAQPSDASTVSATEAYNNALSEAVKKSLNGSSSTASKDPMDEARESLWRDD